MEYVAGYLLIGMFVSFCISFMLPSSPIATKAVCFFLWPIAVIDFVSFVKSKQ